MIQDIGEQLYLCTFKHNKKKQQQHGMTHKYGNFVYDIHILMTIEIPFSITVLLSHSEQNIYRKKSLGWQSKDKNQNNENLQKIKSGKMTFASKNCYFFNNKVFSLSRIY